MLTEESDDIPHVRDSFCFDYIPDYDPNAKEESINQVSGLSHLEGYRDDFSESRS